jgi:hypothetical protein
MANTRENTVTELDKVGCVAEAVLKAIKERKARAQEEAKEKRRAEEAKEKRKAEEAEWECQAKEARRAEVVAKEARVAKAKAEKIRAANKAMQDGIDAHKAEKKRVEEEAARLKVSALAKRWQELSKLGVLLEDPLMQAPKGPGPSREEVQKIRKDVAGQARKRKYGETEISVISLKHQASVKSHY